MVASDASYFMSPHQAGRRHPVNIAAFVRLSFNEEVELNGWIGDETMVGESKKTFRRMTVLSNVGGEECKLSYGLRRVRAHPVSGVVMGQPVTGQAVLNGGAISFEGMAGNEPLRYRLDTGGGCTSFGRDLGVKIVYQSFYSEILGTIERIPDAVMVGLLLPMAIRRHDHAF